MGPEQPNNTPELSLTEYIQLGLGILTVAAVGLLVTRYQDARRAHKEALAALDDAINIYGEVSPEAAAAMQATADASDAVYEAAKAEREEGPG